MNWHDELLHNVATAREADSGMGLEAFVQGILVALQEGVPSADVARAAGLTPRELKQWERSQRSEGVG